MTTNDRNPGKGWRRWLAVMGPGILFASTCIGVSHLVQSTRAGAMAGFGLVWVVVAANVSKYPFFEFGSRYASATGTSLIEGYRTLGRGASWTFLALSLATCFFVAAAVGMVTAAFLDNLLGVSMWLGQPATPWVAAFLFVASTAVLTVGQFRALDRLIKVLAAILLISTVAAVTLAIARPPAPNPDTLAASLDSWQTFTPSLGFLIALMGWMPTAVDLSTWNSIWTLERIESSGYRPSLRETLREFNVGFIVSGVLALGFLTLGALLLYQTGETLPNDSAGFAAGIVSLYAKSMGAWSAPLMGLAAFSAMLGTCIAVLDGYGRSLSRAWAATRNSPPSSDHQTRALMGVALGGLAIVLLFAGSMKLLVDVATTLSFLVAPAIAWWNVKLVTAKQFPQSAKPGRFLILWAWAGLLFLSLFAVVYLIWLCAPWFA
ncbi:MAG: divalent metal cation transporter [Bacteroidetes bacterium]|nr:divalent metal cation transporter [Bacteroidota bacterium]MDA0904509.1 divalent metal cation transporter [Bacteroidota bacterium]MDA1242253.1 divalent metal cation transporter [Bacteroidota bacterium]